MKVSERPIRKRGYYRAVRRGDEWAVAISRMTGFQHLFAFNYRNVDMKELFIKTTRKFLDLIPKDPDYKTGQYFVPFVLRQPEED